MAGKCASADTMTLDDGTDRVLRHGTRSCEKREDGNQIKCPELIKLSLLIPAAAADEPDDH